MTKNGKYTKAEIKAKAKKALERLQNLEQEAEEFVARTNQPAENKYAYMVGWLESELKIKMEDIIYNF